MPVKVRARAAWGSLTREHVVDAAERRVRAGDYENLSIRNLAADLKVSPMSLYGHVRDKDDLLEEVVARLLARRWKPRASRNAWRAWTKEAAKRLRDFLVTEPAALHVYLAHPVVSDVAIERMNMTLEVLRNAGFSEDSAERAYAAIHTYTVGFAALEASRSLNAKNENSDATTAKLARFTTAQQFGEGLDYLLDGLNLRHVQSSKEHRPG